MAIAKVIKFAADGTELKATFGLPNKRFAELFPGAKGRRFDSFHMWVGFAPEVPAKFNGEGSQPVARIIDYKRNPSLHKCDARCLNAKGHTCECSCGGKNHGAGK